MKVKKPLKICTICGDQAFAKNFGAISCKSCKPFFRRNALKAESLKCENGGNCPINQNTRKDCRKCRLDKCFAVGMKSELILNDDEKRLRRCLVEDNRRKRLKDNETNEMDISSDSSLSMNSFEAIITSDKISENEMRLDSDSDYCSEISLLSQSVDNCLIDDQISEVEAFLTISEVFQKAVDSYKQTIDLVSNSLTIDRPFNNYHKNYTEIEEYKLTELLQAFRPSVSCCNKNWPQIISIQNLVEFPGPNNIFYEREIKHLINAIRNISVFKDICENDRIALVKYSGIEILIMRSIRCYDFDIESWIISTSKELAYSLCLEVLKGFKNDVYIVYKNNFNDIIKECDSDYIILDLLTAIALFNPNRPNLINRELVKVEQHYYLYLLQRYLRFKYRTKSESDHKSVKLLNILINAQILSRLEKKYFVEEYQEQYSPLVKEVFDL